MNSAGTTALAVSANEESILNINGSLEEEMLSEEFISEEESTSSAEETQKEEITPPSEETPGEELTPPSEETSGEELTPPSEETPGEELTPPSEESPGKEITPPSEETPGEEIIPPSEEIPEEKITPSTGEVREEEKAFEEQIAQEESPKLQEISEGFDIDFYVIIDGNKVKLQHNDITGIATWKDGRTTYYGVSIEDLLLIYEEFGFVKGSDGQNPVADEKFVSAYRGKSISPAKHIVTAIKITLGLLPSFLFFASIFLLFNRSDFIVDQAVSLFFR